MASFLELIAIDPGLPLNPSPEDPNVAMQEAHLPSPYSLYAFPSHHLVDSRDSSGVDTVFSPILYRN